MKSLTLILGLAYDTTNLVSHKWVDNFKLPITTQIEPSNRDFAVAGLTCLFNNFPSFNIEFLSEHPECRLSAFYKLRHVIGYFSEYPSGNNRKWLLSP